MSNFNVNDLYIVLIEPSPTQQKFIVQQLEDAGTGDIKAFYTGGDALVAMQNDLPDLVISSMYFDDMTGIDLVTKMRED